MKHICPYDFSATTRADQIAAILTDAQGKPRRAYDRFFFNWDVKAYSVNTERPQGEYALDAALDEAWQERVEDTKQFGVFEAALEDTQRTYFEGEYTSYPGNDQGDWHFSFQGRSGGHLCLAKWRGRDMTRFDSEDFNDPDDWSDAEIADFYRGLVCCDSDLTRANAAENVECNLNFIRGQWEDEMHAEREAADTASALAMMAARPDMYPVA